MDSTPSGPCHCGRVVGDVHPCHWGGYTCANPGTVRFYYTGPAYVAGMMPKVSAARTIACDEHWAAFVAARAGAS